MYKTITISLFLVLILVAPAFAAFDPSTGWTVNSSGSDSNGACFAPLIVGVPSGGTNGTLLSPVTYTDLVIGATNTQITSVAHPFSSASVGNCINISSGTGFTVQTVQIISVTGVTATCDKAVGTALSTGGHGIYGGAYANYSTALAILVTFNTIWLKSGTTVTTTSAFTKNIAGGFSVATASYTSVWGDNAGQNCSTITCPLVTTATNSTLLFSPTGSGIMAFEQIAFSNTAATSAPAFGSTSAIWQLSLDGCKIGPTFTTAIDGDNSTYYGIELVMRNTEITGTTAAAVLDNAGLGVTLDGNYIHGNTGTVGSDSHTVLEFNGLGGPLTVTNNLIVNNTGTGLYANLSLTIFTLYIRNNTFAFNSVAGGSGGLSFVQYTSAFIESNIFYGNSPYGIGSSIPLTPFPYDRNAFGDNATGDANGIGTGTNSITGIGNPFVNSSSGNFALNSTAGAGSLLKGAGSPAVFAGGTSTSYPDIGAVQSASSSGGVGPSGYVF